MNILVVDDELPIVRGIVKMLEQEEWIGIEKVFSAYSRDQALHIMENEKIDLLFTDIKMQNGSGLSLLSKMEEKNISCIRIIITSYPSFEFAQEAIELGVDGYLLKPVTRENIQQIIKKALDKRKGKDFPELYSIDSQQVSHTSMIKKAQKYIEDHLSEDLNRQLVADAVHVNPDYLSRMLKEDTGRSLSEYIKYRRILEAQKLLDYSEFTITQIAEAAGFKNTPYFSTVFKQVTGFTPLDYRNRHHNDCHKSEF
ncbi:MAG: response regulator [Eubacteriales bacterium]|nr:response regulator [Eubacteriales bacterium]